MFWYSPPPQKTSSVTFLSRTAMTAQASQQQWFANIAYPNPNTERLLVGVITWETGSSTVTVSNVTVDSVSATIHIQQNDNGGTTGMGIAIFSVKTSNTSGNTFIQMSSGFFITSNLACHMYSLYSPQNTTPFSTSTILGHAQIPQTNTISLCNKGIVIAGLTGSTNTVTSNCVMTIPGVTLSNAYSNNAYNGSVVGNYGMNFTANTATWIANTNPIRLNSGIVGAAVVWQGNF